MKSISLAFFLGLCCWITTAQAKTEEEVNNFLKQTTIADFTVENMSGPDALAAVQKLANLNENHIYFNVGAKEKLKKGVVTLGVQNVTVYNLITMICSLCDVQFTIRKDQVLIFEPGNIPAP